MASAVQFSQPYIIDDVVPNILQNLTVAELLKTSQVSKKWHEMALSSQVWQKLDLEKVFHGKVRVFDEWAWREHSDVAALGLDLQIESMDNFSAVKQITELFSRLKKEGLDVRRLTILTIPGNFNEQILDAFATSQGMGFLGNHRALPGTAVQDAYRVVIAHGSFAGSQDRCLPIYERQIRNLGGESPKVIELATLVFVSYVRDGVSLFQNYEYGRCSDEDGKWVVGNFSGMWLQMVRDPLTNPTYGAVFCKVCDFAKKELLPVKGS